VEFKKYGHLLKNRYFLILVSILIFAFFIRLYYFNINSTIWWDESEYLLKAKDIAFGTGFQDAYKFSPRKPILMPLLWGLFYKLGANEFILRLIQVIFSTIAIGLVYLLGKEMYNKKVGLIASFIMSVFWLHIFLTARLLTDVPSLTFFLAFIYFFWKGYIKNENKKYLWFCGIAGGLTLLARVDALLILPSFLLFFLVTEKLNFLKNKEFYKILVGGILTVLPYFVWFILNYSTPIKTFTGVGEGRFANSMLFPGIWAYFKLFISYLNIFYLILFLIGLYILIDLILGFDLIKKEAILKSNFFIVLWIIPYIFFFGFIGAQIEERFILKIFPAVFLIIANGSLKLNEMIKKYNVNLAHILIIFLLIGGGISQLDYANKTIEAKKDSYLPVKEAAIWMKQNSAPNDVIITNSVPQNIYYSDRYTYYFNTPEEFKAKVKELKPKYMVASAFERSHDWYYKYPIENNLTIAQAYFADQQRTQPLLIIYQF